MGDYFGEGPAYISGLGFRLKGERPKITNEFSKSLLTDIDENGEGYYIDKYGRKVYGTELKNLDVEEISYVNFPATKMKFSVVKNEEGENLKGDEKMLIELKPEELSTVRETISILNKYELTGELLEARKVLTKNFGSRPEKYPYPERVKKYNDKVEWTTIQNQLYNFSEDDLSFISDEDIEIEKSEDDPFPSLTRQF
ncbi:unnamed protein product, partial [marine sediment metagenome]